MLIFGLISSLINSFHQLIIFVFQLIGFTSNKMNPEIENDNSKTATENDNGEHPTENGSENVDAEVPTKKTTKVEKREFLFP